MLPLLSRDSSLVKNPDQQIRTDISIMRIGNANIDIVTRHKGMLAAGKRSVKSQILQSPDEFSSGSRSQLDYAKRALRSYLPVVGTNRCFRILISSHSSNTSRRSRSHSCRVFPSAHTPVKPGILPKYIRLRSIRSKRALRMTDSTNRVNMGSLYHRKSLFSSR